MKRAFLLTSLLVGALLILHAFTSLATPRPTPTATAGETVNVWLTTGDGNKKLQQQPNVNFSPGTGSNSLQIQIDESTTYQQMDGFGAALTDSAAWLISNTLSTYQRDDLMSNLFSPSDGIGISYVRLPMGASEFVEDEWYTYDDMPQGVTDTHLISFSIAHDQEYIIPILQQAKSINPQLKVMGSPWSAPAWMKSPETLYGGSLQPGNYQTYANYFVKFVQAYQATSIPIHAVTVQNEPHHEDNSYPTMRMEWFEQASFVKDHLGPAFDNASINTKILIWDQNWDEPNYPLNVLNDATAKAYVAGSAWHCYAGTPAAQILMHEAHPDKNIYFTECTGGEWDTDFASVLVWNFHNLFIGAVRRWAKTVLLWNLALDENHGPHIGGCDNCHGVVTIHQDGTVDYNVEYYIIGHLSKIVAPGAYRIASNTYDEQIETVAFWNPDDDSKALIALNSTTNTITFDVQWSGQHFSYTLPAQSVATFKWSETRRVYLPLVLKASQ
jgi:glucosylceramidase